MLNRRLTQAVDIAKAQNSAYKDLASRHQEGRDRYQKLNEELSIAKAKINELEGHLNIVKTALTNATTDLAEREAGIKSYAEKCIQWKQGNAALKEALDQKEKEL